MSYPPEGRALARQLWLAKPAERRGSPLASVHRADGATGAQLPFPGGHAVIRVTPSKTDVKLTFIVDQTAPAGPVSVVGTFNDWSPYAHVLRRRSNGTRSVAVTVPAGQEVRFRYLASGGHWFDDPDATEHGPDGGVLRL